MTLSNKHLKDVCLLNSSSSKTCRYLYNDDLEENKWYCCKLKQDLKNKIDKEVNSFLSRTDSKHLEKSTKSLGDNCSGYPILRTIIQGYDVD